jgi:hypothetical protein
LPQKAKGICHLVIQCATSVGGEINQSKPKNEKPINWKSLLICRVKAPNLQIGGSFKNIPSKA